MRDATELGVLKRSVIFFILIEKFSFGNDQQHTCIINGECYIYIVKIGIMEYFLWHGRDKDFLGRNTDQRIQFPSTLFILVDYPIHIDTISLELSILYFKRLAVKISLK